MIRNESFVWGLVVAPIALLGLSVAVAQNVSVPHTFVPGTPALASEVNRNFAAQSVAINDNDARLNALEMPTPSFSASVSAPSLLGKGTIVFDTESHDEGNVFDPATGTFTAPQTGVYQISFVTRYAGTDGLIQMLKNGSEVIGATWVTLGGVDTEGIPASIILSVRLRSGDTVTVERQSSLTRLWGTSVHGPFTFISGHLIR